MKISVKQKTNTETMAIVLEHDLVASNAQILRRDLLPRVWEGTRVVEIDFRHVKMIDSIGIASLIAVYNTLRRSGGMLRLLNVSAEIYHLLHTMRLDRQFEVKTLGWEDLFMKRRKILIIDDEEGIRKMMRLALERAGYEVLDAPDGRQGLKIYSQCLPDLVITDIFMPEMEGLETIMALRRENPTVKIISISGGGSCRYDYLPAALKLGALRAIAKPFSLRELLSTVLDLLEIHSGAGYGENMT
jgi:anti-anti-sigma factor